MGLADLVGGSDVRLAERSLGKNSRSFMSVQRSEAAFCKKLSAEPEECETSALGTLLE